MNHAIGTAGLAATLALGAAAAQAGNDPAEFVAPYLAAIRSGDPQRLEALLHSKSRACITPKNRSMVDFKWERKLTRGTAEPVAVSASPFEPRLAAGTPQSDYPVAPSHRLQLEFGKAPNTFTTILLLAQENGQWRFVEPCPETH